MPSDYDIARREMAKLPRLWLAGAKDHEKLTWLDAFVAGLRFQRAAQEAQQ